MTSSHHGEILPNQGAQICLSVSSLSSSHPLKLRRVSSGAPIPINLAFKYLMAGTMAVPKASPLEDDCSLFLQPVLT